MVFGKDQEMHGKNNPFYSRHHSEETKRKISKSKKGQRPWLGKRHSKESKLKMSLSKKGKHYSPKTEFKKGNPSMFKGRHHTEELRKKMSNAKKGKRLSKECKIKISIASKKHWQTLEYREKVIKNTLKSLFNRPTKLEKKMINLIKTNNLPFSYCGNGTLMIGYKCPDFYENNGKKICIEVASKKEKEIHRKISWKKYEMERKKHFKEWGWKCIVIWDNEFEDKEKILEKLAKSI